MKTMIYLVEGIDHSALTPKEREILGAIGDGITPAGLAKVLHELTDTANAKLKFYDRVRSIADKGFLRTEKIGLAIA